MESRGRSGSAAAAPITRVIKGLNDLLQLDHDAVGAYEIAIEHLEDRAFAAQIEGFMEDHRRHIRNLNDLILSLGGNPSNEPHATAPLKQAIQRVGAAGGDRVLLNAWRANELQATLKYDAYAQKARSWPPEAKRVVDENALDEERHYRWVVDVLGDDDPGEVHAANKAREQMARARRRAGRAGEQLDQIAGTIRERAAAGLTGAADRLDEFARSGRDRQGIRARTADGADRLGHGLGTTAKYLRDGGGMRETLEREIRDHPARSLVAIFGIGFLVGRILR